MILIFFLQQFFADDIQLRGDTLLSGHVEVLADEVERTPKDDLYGRVLGEVAELENKEALDGLRSPSGSNDLIFFMQIGGNGSLPYCQRMRPPFRHHTGSGERGNVFARS